ncbi:uncharacterized protein [Rutidosis leptorrhynchoides]|uniref:uncharacterized protein n=1 Tax=Rutidosis leptorrhynchoides TaxID=125765 RepID=UPI003A999669
MSAVQEFTPLNEIVKGQEKITVKVKVLFLWKKYWVNNPSDVSSIEMGNKMRAAIEKDTVKYYGPTFTEGRYLTIYKFDVLDVDDKIKFLTNKLKLRIRKSSKVQKCPEFSVEQDLYRIVTFQQINERELKYGSDIFDVCGRVINIIRNRTIKERSGDKKKLKFFLLSPSGETIRCALWGEHGKRLLTMARKCYANSPPIVALIHNCQLKLWEGGPEVNNIFFGTRLYLNELVHPISTFNSEFANAPNKGELNAIPTMSPDFREDEQEIGAKYTKCHLLKVEQVPNYQEDYNFVVIGKVVKVCNSDGWFQRLCPVHENKLAEVYNCDLDVDVLWCEFCKVDDQKWIPRIRTSITIKDDTGACDIILFDNHLAKLVKRSATWLNTRAGSCVNPVDVPAELNDVVKQTFLFLVRKSTFNEKLNYKSYTVMDATDDVDIMDEVSRKGNKPDVDNYNATQQDEKFETPKPFKALLAHSGGSASGSECNTGESSDGKRKAATVDEVGNEETPTGGTAAGISALKIPKMEPL